MILSLKLKKCAKSNKGSTIMFFILILAFFMLAGTLAIDYAFMSTMKAKLSAAVDAGTIAGANELANVIIKNKNADSEDNVSDSDLTNNVTAKVKDYIELNMGYSTVTWSEDDIASSEANTVEKKVTGNNGVVINIIINKYQNTVEVTAQTPYAHNFAQYFGMTNSNLVCSAKAKVGKLNSIVGPLPVGLKAGYTTDSAGNVELVPKSGNNGNFMFLDLDALPTQGNGGGSNELENWITGESKPVMSIPCDIFSETGVMSNLKAAFKALTNEIVYIPIVVFGETVSGKTKMTITGLVAAQITVPNGRLTLDAKIISAVGQGEINDSTTIENIDQYTVLGVNLIE